MIIASHSRYLLQRHLKRPEWRGGGLYFSPVPLPAGLEDALRARGLQPLVLPDLADSERDQALRQYVALMSRLDRANADHPLWWATELAARNRFTSPLAGLLTAYVQCGRATEAATTANRPLVLWDAPWSWVAAQPRVQMLAWPWARFLFRCYGAAAAWGELLRGAVVSLFVVLATRLLGARRLIPDTGKHPVILIRSFIYASSVASGRFNDPFFGRLGEIAGAAAGGALSPLTVVQGTGTRLALYRQLVGLADQHIVPVEAYLGVADVLLGLASVLRFRLLRRFSVPEGLPLLGTDLAPALRELLAAGGWRLQLLQCLHERAACRIMRRHRVRACALPYEGNAWERMFIRGLRGSTDTPRILGFQHSVVPPAAAGMFVGREALGITPLPDTVLTTGEQPAAILRRYGALPAQRVGKAGALRYEYLQQLDAAPRRRGQEGRILVALEGVGPVLSMLGYALDQAARLPDIRFRIRAHPVLPLGVLLSRLGRSAARLASNIEVAVPGPVRDDVLASDAVLYWGSTVAVEALFMGRPVIHYSAGELLSYDPLFELRDFKWTCRREHSLEAIMSAILRMDDEACALQQRRAREYVRGYFEPVDDGRIGSQLHAAVAALTHD